MLRVAVAVLAVLAAMVTAIAPAAAQLGIPSPVPLPGAGQVAPSVSYIWYEPRRAEVESGRGLEAAAVFRFLGPVRGRIQYAWPQSGNYSNLGLAAVIGWGGPIYLGAGYERSSGRETFPVARDLSESQPYAFVGLTQKSTLYALIFEAERSFGDELEGTTLKAGVSMSW